MRLPRYPHKCAQMHIYVHTFLFNVPSKSICVDMYIIHICINKYISDIYIYIFKCI